MKSTIISFLENLNTYEKVFDYASTFNNSWIVVHEEELEIGIYSVNIKLKAWWENKDGQMKMRDFAVECCDVFESNGKLIYDVNDCIQYITNPLEQYSI